MRIIYNSLGRECISAIAEIPHDFLFILCDSQVYYLHKEGALKDILSMLHPTRLQVFEASERSKSIDSAIDLWEWLIAEGATRKSLLVNIGGGVVTDLGGYVASCYMRGIKTINIPTTLLAMVDASTGGKTGVNHQGIKNIIGAFYMPEEVIIDTCFLSTQAIPDLLSGYAEVIKHALLGGMESWKKCCMTDPLALTGEEWKDIVAENVIFKESIVAADFKESGLRKILNLGHTFGHAIESLSHYKQLAPLKHGEAVAIGMIIELYLTSSLLGASTKTLYQLVQICRENFSPYAYNCKDYDSIIGYMTHDKKNAGNKISFIGLAQPGETKAIEIEDKEILKKGLDFYRETFGG